MAPAAPSAQPAAPAALFIAVLGTPGTGHVALAEALARRLAEETGLRCAAGPLPDRGAAVGSGVSEAFAWDVFVCHAQTLLHSAQWHRTHVALTLLTALDLLQQDPAAERADTALRSRLQAAGVTWMLAAGVGVVRLESALDAAAALLRARETPRGGLLTRLTRRNAAAPPWQWVCEKCDVPECEHAQRVSSAHRRPAAGLPRE